MLWWPSLYIHKVRYMTSAVSNILQYLHITWYSKSGHQRRSPKRSVYTIKHLVLRWAQQTPGGGHEAARSLHALPVRVRLSLSLPLSWQTHNADPTFHSTSVSPPLTTPKLSCFPPLSSSQIGIKKIYIQKITTPWDDDDGCSLSLKPPTLSPHLQCVQLSSRSSSSSISSSALSLYPLSTRTARWRSFPMPRPWNRTPRDRDLRRTASPTWSIGHWRRSSPRMTSSLKVFGLNFFFELLSFLAFVRVIVFDVIYDLGFCIYWKSLCRTWVERYFTWIYSSDSFKNTSNGQNQI